MVRSAIGSLRRAWREPFVRLLTSVLIIALLLARLPLADLQRTLRQISASVWLASLAIVLSGHVANMQKWRLLITVRRSHLPIWVALRCHFTGLFANLFLPSVAGGDLVRGGMAISFAGEKEEVILGSLLDRLLDTASLALFAAVGSWTVPRAISQTDQRVLAHIAALSVAFGLCCAILLAIPLAQWVPSYLSKPIERARDMIGYLARHPRRTLVSAAISIAVQGTFVLLNAGLGAAVGIHVPLAVWFLAWPMAKLLAMLPISLGGLGVREAALAALLGRFGIPSAKSVGLGLLWETMFMASAGIGAIFYVLAQARRAELG